MMFFNGAAQSDGAGARVVFVSPQRQVLTYAFTLGEKCSNNVAEYQALIIGLQMALELGIPSLAVSGNSKLVINQLLKEYEVKKEDLVPYFRYATNLINKFKSVELEHIPREENQDEVDQAMDEAHSGVCGAQQSGPKLHFRIKRMGYYWLTMVKDYLDYAKRCQACQFHANFIHQPPELLHPTVVSWPFDGWGQDVVGLQQKSFGGHLYILAVTDYFSKWAEAFPLKEVKKEIVVNFIKNNLIFRYGVPRLYHHRQWKAFLQYTDGSTLHQFWFQAAQLLNV
ncbi:hypothetical protein RJ639_019602 [Escallonia herrerae]|uniref:Uncharacterized protein n=1 Tax=Escallonia herrerae TaxID=1293975 RepID=A0AA89AKP1_9ASTE|nr:hypothetical protein RJ639_019602 [Escallonia herrerae]